MELKSRRFLRLRSPWGWPPSRGSPVGWCPGSVGGRGTPLPSTELLWVGGERPLWARCPRIPLLRCASPVLCAVWSCYNRSGRLRGGPQVLGPGPHGLPCGRSTRVCWGLRPVAAGLARGLQLLWFRLPAVQRGRREEATATPAVSSQSWSPAPAPGDPGLGALPDAVLKSTRDDTRDGLWPVQCCACERAATPAWGQGYTETITWQKEKLTCLGQ